MLAVVMQELGPEDVLQLEEVEDPRPGPGEALIRVGAVEVSRTRDVATRAGHHPFSRVISLPHVLGGDFAGIVEATGAGVDRSLLGQRVAASSTQTCGHCKECLAGYEQRCSELSMLGIHRWGSYAELVSVSASCLHRIPADMSMVEAAAMAATGPIAFAQLHVGQVQDGKWLLVTGATGALGTTLIALARERGARVVGLSRRPTSIPSELDLEGRVDVADDDLPGTLMDLTDGEGITTAIDNVSAGDVFARYFPALAIGARVVVSGAIGTPELPVLPVPAAPLYLRSLSLLGVRTNTSREAELFWAKLREGFRMPAALVHEFPLDGAAAAHAQIASGERVGHTVLSVPS